MSLVVIPVRSCDSFPGELNSDFDTGVSIANVAVSCGAILLTCVWIFATACCNVFIASWCLSVVLYVCCVSSAFN